MSTEVIIQGNSTRPLYRKIVRDGIPGNQQVLFEMVRLARNSVKYDLGVTQLADNLLVNNSLNSYSPAIDQLNAVFNFVASNVVYIQDVAGRVESLKAARVTLSDGFGDCDDQAILNATLLGCIGFEDVKIAMARYSKDAETFQHVYAVCYADGKRFVLDTTLPDPQLNKEVKAYEVKEIPVFADVPGIDGFSGIFNNAKHYARKTARGAVKLLPKVGLVVPMGFLADSALTTGVGLIENATGDNRTLSLPATASAINKELDTIIVDLTQSKIAYDVAKTYALQLAAQLMAIEIKPEDGYTLEVVKTSLKDKLNFIKNFPEYAKANNIKVVHLHSGMMLAAGIGLAAGAGYVAYRHYKGRGDF